MSRMAVLGSVAAVRLALVLDSSMVTMGAEPPAQEFREQIGDHSAKIKHESGKTLLWSRNKPGQPNQSEWFDFSDSSIPIGQLQFGIGKDIIRAVDDPLFVDPSDTRLATLPESPYRKDERNLSKSELPVIGLEINGDARAYPLGYLDFHEIVNDTFGNTPVTLVWLPLVEKIFVFERPSNSSADTFGQSGYSFQNKPLLYDRDSQSLWYASGNDTIRAVTGSRKNESLRLLRAAKLTSLGEWRTLHQETKVLLGSANDIRRSEGQ